MPLYFNLQIIIHTHFILDYTERVSKIKTLKRTYEEQRRQQICGQS